MAPGVMSTAFDLTIGIAMLLGAENPRVLPFALQPFDEKINKNERLARTF